VSFAAAHADGRPHRALPQKPKLESLNIGKTVAARSRKGLPYIYALLISESNGLDAIRESFLTAKTKEKNGRAYARLNKETSYCFYVGSSYDFSKRYKEHIGYGAKATYALQLRHWAKDFPSLQLTLAYAEYHQGTE
jgi:hypothetical protein